MKILYILSDTFIAGGATKSFVTMLHAALDAGHEAAVVCNDDKGVTRYLQSIGVTTVVRPYRFASLPTVSLAVKDIIRFVPRFVRDRIVNPRSAKSVLEFAREFRPDIIHENTSVTGIGSYVAKRLGIPHIIHIREYADKDFRIYLLNYRKRLRYEKVYPVAITKDLASYRCDRLGICRKARVIYNGIIDDNSIAYDRHKEPYFLYAGRIEPNKGIEDLIDAYISYRQVAGRSVETLQLKIAGTYHQKSFIERLRLKVIKSGLADDVIWLGECKEMNSLYSKAAATIIPSRCEGFGRIPSEAMAAGSLCVMRDSGGLHEQLDNGVLVTGEEIALRFESIPELTDALVEISRDYNESPQGASRYEEMIRFAQLTVRKLYTKRVYGDNILALYNDIHNQQ